MCKLLNINRSTYYYKPKVFELNNELDELVIKIFKDSRNNYGARKIKAELNKMSIIVSIRKIRIIMKRNSLVSNYTVKHYKIHHNKCNESEVGNVVNREFKRDKHLDVVVSDLTYVRVKDKWCYICLLIDLYNREIIGYSCGENKTAELVYKALSTVKYPLDKINIFHTDRGKEFDNKIIDDALETFCITRSLSHKGTPYDNAVAESTYKIIKTEFAFNRMFNSIEELQYLLFDYVNWYNKIRIHSSLNYLSPIDFRLSNA